MSIKKDLFKQIGAYLMATLKDLPLELNLPDLQHFDKQMGQFTNPELSYAIPLPCVLMEYGQFNWKTVGKNQQRGDGYIRFYLYFENYADSFTGSVNQELALQFFEYSEQLNMALNGFSLPGMKSLERVSDNEDTAQDMIITSMVDFGTVIDDIASDYTRNFVMADPDVTVIRVKQTSRPPGTPFTDGFIMP
ncbi:hypothetical protein [Mucilaginibacter lappiensis]|uniref:Uncharacterized protein n=1 Tax=Mucilaginibacter lappiensis TaxID=354630 RepID=A0A841JST7_9SPHI|nr:hypothetical protein [Mucilaginibacter lappiensis]MBB6131345.1 hypothetical protein [Mucilaginibacter lappiensis]